MIISSGWDAIHCMMLMGTFTGTNLHWLSGILDGHITPFQQFSIIFKERFSANKFDPSWFPDLFDVRKREGESLKDYLNHYCAFSVRLSTPNEEKVVSAFVKGMSASPFSGSLIRNWFESMVDVRERAVAHIEVEEAIIVKNDNS